MNRQHLRFDELHDAAAKRNLAVELHVSDTPRGEQGKEHRDLTLLRVVRPIGNGKGELITERPIAAGDIDGAAIGCLAFLQGGPPR